jgi:hypothetical protein
MRANLLIPLLVLLEATKLALDHFSDVDLYWHLRLGLDMLARGELPAAVEYTWTVRGAPYLANDWLAEIALALAFRAGGFLGVALLKALAAAVLALLLYAAALLRADGNSRAAGLAVAVMLFVGATNFIARPVLLGHVCLALELVSLELLWRGRRWAALGLGVAFGLWVNLHGSWPVGLAPLAAALMAASRPVSWRRLGDRPLPAKARRWLAAGAVLGVAALFANPVGPRLLTRPFGMFGARAHLGVLKEWSPVPFEDPSAWILFGAAALLALACWRSKRPLPLWDLGVVAATFAMACSTALYHLPFAVVAAPVLAEQLSSLLSRKGLSKPGVNLAVAASAALVLGGVMLARVQLIPLDVRSEIPVDAIDELERSGLAQERGFNFFDFGGFLVFRKIPTLVDGRLEPFLHAGVFDRYVALETRGDVESLEKEGVRWILARTGTRMAAVAAARPGWRPLHRGEIGELFVRE